MQHIICWKRVTINVIQSVINDIKYPEESNFTTWRLFRRIFHHTYWINREITIRQFSVLNSMTQSGQNESKSVLARFQNNFYFMLIFGIIETFLFGWTIWGWPNTVQKGSRFFNSRIVGSKRGFRIEIVIFYRK